MNKTQTLAQQLINGLLVLAVIVLLGFLSVRYSVQQDWTVGKRNTISDATRQQLASMADPVRFVAFSYPGAEDRAFIEYQVNKYQRFKPDLSLDFIDPSSQPLVVREYGVTFAGQVAVEYQGRRELLSQLSESEITGALQRLSFGGETWVVFLEGHGERGLEADQGTEALARFAQALRDKGLKLQSVNLVANPVIPDNTAVLVVASPRSELFEGEIRLIDEYVQRGGNLLWLADPEAAPGLETLASTLGVSWREGYAIFPEYEMIGTGHPAIFAALDYPPNPVTQGLDQVTLFPFVRGVRVANPDSGWTALPMLTSSEAAWLETGPIDSTEIAFDFAAGDRPGPIEIGLSLTRPKPQPAPASPGAEDSTAVDPLTPVEQQRVVLIGDADFLSDGFIGEAGNQRLGLNLVQWLAARDNQINIDVPPVPDLEMFLPRWAQALQALGFVIVLPLLLLGFGMGRWALRRRR